MDKEKERLLAVIREYYGRVVWTHKVHEKQRELNTKTVKRDKWINVVLMALAATGVLASIPLGSPWATIAAATLAFISTGFAIYQISFSPEIEIYQHRQAAKELLVERDKLVLLIEMLMSPNANIDGIRQEFRHAVEQIGQMYGSSPDTSSKAFEMAKKSLKFNDEFTFSPEEIDLLLPEAMRLEQGNQKNSS